MPRSEGVVVPVAWLGVRHGGERGALHWNARIFSALWQHARFSSSKLSTPCSHLTTAVVTTVTRDRRRRLGPFAKFTPLVDRTTLPTCGARIKRTGHDTALFSNGHLASSSNTSFFIPGLQRLLRFATYPLPLDITPNHCSRVSLPRNAFVSSTPYFATIVCTVRRNQKL